MNDPTEPEQTTADRSAPADSLDAGLAAGFGRPADGPGSMMTRLLDDYGALPPVLLRDAEDDSAHVLRPRSDAMPRAAEAGERYQLAGEIARGGMGAVLRGRDVELGRELAVKVLLEKYVERPEIARRFIEEAQIGGQLQHPGVVPVYDIGRFGERPFFTMKLVKGRTLAASSASEPSRTRTGRGCWRSALQVAQTLAYAHAKGVIHRDLKPANIMVGAFGEVQVMDWGLAKVLAEGGIADEERPAGPPARGVEPTVIRTARAARPRRFRDAGRLAAGHARLHAAGAGQWRRRQPRPPRRRLRPRRDPLRDPDRASPPTWADRRGGPPQGRQRRPGRRPAHDWPPAGPTPNPRR